MQDEPAAPITPSPVIPMITREQMDAILSSRHTLTSEEAYQEIERHTGRSRPPGRRKTSINGQTLWVCC
jgi:hypothetical protein